MIITGKHFTNLSGNFFNASGAAPKSYDDIARNINYLIDTILNKGINSGYSARQMADFVRAKKMTDLGILQMNELLIVQAVASGDKNQSLVNAYNNILSNKTYNRYLAQNRTH